MGDLVTQMGTVSMNWLNVIKIPLLMLGIAIAVISLGRVAIKFMAVRNAEEKALAASNLLDIAIGVIFLGLISSIVLWAIFNFL